MFYRNTLITDRGKSWADDTIFWGGSNFDPRPQSWNHRGYPETDPLETSKYTIYTTILKHNHEKQEIQHWHAHQTISKNEELSKILRLWQKATKTKNTKYKIQNKNKKSSPSSRRRPGRAQRFLASRCFSSPWKVYDLDTGNVFPACHCDFPNNQPYLFHLFVPQHFYCQIVHPKMRKHVL